MMHPSGDGVLNDLILRLSLSLKPSRMDWYHPIHGTRFADCCEPQKVLNMPVLTQSGVFYLGIDFCYLAEL